MNIIIAPHPDDELIGCYSLIKKGWIDHVIYLATTPERYQYATIVGKELGFTVELSDYRCLIKILSRNLEDVYLVPDAFDNHLLHQAANCIARLSGCCLGYYTTNMNTGYTRELSKEVQQEKRMALNKYYPDQKSLWENDWKYFLFEGIVFEPSQKN